jgi:hypothetical protein
MITLLLIAFRLALLALVLTLIWKAVFGETSRRGVGSRPRRSFRQQRFDASNENITDADYEELP